MTRQREPRLLDSGFLAFVRQQPCCICGVTTGVEAAHIRIGWFATRMKPHDRLATPLCAWHHRLAPDAQHATGDEAGWWSGHGLDPFDIAAWLYAEYGGAGGAPRQKRKTKKRPPPDKRQKIKSRGFQKKERTCSL